MPTNNAWNSTNPAGVVSGGTGLGTLTSHYTLVGAGTSPVTLIAPSATSGIPYISQGASADPLYGTAVVAGGGTGDTSFTAYAVICGGTTSTGALQNVSGVGTSGQVLTSNGAAALPTWQTPSGGGGALVQQVRAETQSTTSGSAALAPNSAAAPINGAGITLFTLSITPTSSSHVLVLQACVSINCSTGGVYCFFQNGVTNALATAIAGQTGAFTGLPLIYSMTAGSTSALTFTLQYGTVTSNTATINSIGTGNYGGTFTTWFSITEYTA